MSRKRESLLFADSKKRQPAVDVGVIPNLGVPCSNHGRGTTFSIQFLFSFLFTGSGLL